MAQLPIEVPQIGSPPTIQPPVIPSPAGLSAGLGAAPNSAPLIISLMPNMRSPQVAGTKITWNVNALDPDGDTISYRFRLNGPSTDGNWMNMTDWSNDSSWTWATTESDLGRNQIEVWIRDGKHAGTEGFDDRKSASFTISSPAAGPSAQPEIQQPVAPTNVTLPITIPGVPSIPSGITRRQEVSQPAVSQPAVSAPAVNQPPAIQSLTPDKSSPQDSGTAMTWTANATDPDGDQILYRFFLNGRPVTDWITDNTWLWQTTDADVGNNRIEVRVRDGKHAGTTGSDDRKSDSFVIIIPAPAPAQLPITLVQAPPVQAPANATQPAPSEVNSPPVINSLTPDKSSPQAAGESITWTADAADPDGDNILYRFFLNAQPQTGWTNDNTWVWKTVNTDIGNNRIEVRVRDGKHAGTNGFDDRTSASFTINAPTITPAVQPMIQQPVAPPNVTLPIMIPGMPSTPAGITQQQQVSPPTVSQPTMNQPPAVQSLTPDKPSPQAAGEVITWTANTTDPDGDQILYRFLLNGRPTTDWSTNNTWIWNTSLGDIGNNRIEVRVRDGFHAGPDSYDSNKVVRFTINTPTRPPVIPQITAPVTAPVIAPVTTPVTANVTPFINVTPAGAVAPTRNITQPTPAIPAPTIVNTPPTISSLAPDKPSPQAAGTIVNWTASATDPDGDEVLFRFLLNGRPMTDWSSNSTWSWDTTGANIGGNRIEVRARDGQHAGPEGFDDRRTESYIITPQVPRPPTIRPPTVTPAIAPINITPAQNVTPTRNVTQAVVPTRNITLPITIPTNVTPALNITPRINITVPTVPKVPTVPTVPAVSPAGNNTPPVLRSLMPDKPSPQLTGASIVWTADAVDTDGDQILYRFFLNGPSTGGSWRPETDWSTGNTWTWSTASADVGQNQIRVWARDGKHADENSFDSEQLALFTITAPAKNISGMKFNDLNGNGAKDANEPGLASWRITLTKPDGSTVSTLTEADGSFKFEGLAPDSYTISETAQTGWSATAPAGGSQRVTLGSSDITDTNFANRISAFSISGKKFNDLNGNGVNDGEPGLAGWTINLAMPDGRTNTTVTGADGSFRFDGLAPGSYTLTEEIKTGWTRTAPAGGSHSVTLQDRDVTGIDFGNKVSATWSISGTKYNDLNGNGARDANEPGLSNWKIQLTQGGSIVNATLTGDDGSYRFTGLAPGAYTVSEVLQSGFAQTAPGSGSYSVNLADKDVAGQDFGNKGNVSIISKKFYDINKNGIQDPGEPGIPGLAVHLQENGREIATTTTDNDGSYTFSGLLPGTYTVVDPVPNGLIVTTSTTVTVTVTTTTTIITSANFGIIGPYSIFGVKYNDLNGNGVRDSGEPGISGWSIVLTGNAWFGAPLPPQTVSTAADGSYTFSGLLPGTYKVSEVSRTGWTQTAPSAGSYTVTFNLGAPPSTSTGNDFGNRLLTPPGTGSIAGVKFNDLNGNGINDGDPGLKGWTIQLKNATNNTVVRSATTDESGGYVFLNLPPGSYVVSEVLKTGWSQTAPSSGSYSFTLAASESKIGIDFGNYNPPPTNPALTPSPASPQPVGTPITWTASATDPDGDRLRYRFFIRAPGGALLTDTHYISHNTWTWNTAGLFPGTYQAEVWIRDGFHAGPGSYDVRATASFILIQGNTPPVVDFLFADRPSPQFAGSWIRWTTIAHDPDGDQLQYRYLLRGPSTFGFWEDQTGWTTDSRWIWRTTGFDVGVNQILVLVRDGRHSGPGGWDDYDIAGYAILAVNTPPVITSLSTNVPSPQPIGAAVRWSATAFDPDGDLLFYRYWMKGPSTGGLWKLVRDWSTDNTWTWLTSPADVGVSQVDVQVRDGYHAGPFSWDDDASGLFTILRPNLPPQLSSLSPDKPGPQTAGTPVGWIASATDSDGDPILFRFWLKGPSTGNAWRIVQDWSYSNTWTWTSTPGDAGDYSVYVYARDGYHSGPNGYDSALGQRYTLSAPQAVIRLTAGTILKNNPSLIFTGDGYLMAYQSFGQGPGYPGDIDLQRYDPTWNALKSVVAANDTEYEGSPSVIFANGYYYVAYASRQTGNLNIFLKKFDADLNYIETRQLTDSVTDQDSPSLISLDSEFFVAYQSWDTGSQNGGDIFLTQFDQNWNPLTTIHVTDLASYQNHPSLTLASGNFYVAYASNETGNMNIFVSRYDPGLNLLDTRRMTFDISNHDFPSLNWINGQFLMLYDSDNAGIHGVYLDRYLRDWTTIESTSLVAETGYQTSSSMAYSAFDDTYWVAYSSADPEGQNIYAKPLKLMMPSELKPCEIVPSFSSTKAYSPYTLTLRFYNNYGELTDPVDLGFVPPQDSARPTDQLQRTAPGTIQFSSVFGAPGDKSFNIGANIDGCIASEVVTVKVV